jgi:hypothetical protein
MDDRRHSDSQIALDTQLGSEAAPIVNARRDTPMADAPRCSPDDRMQRRNDPPSRRRVVTTCFHGDELNEGIITAFRIMGIDAPLP